MQGFHSSDRHAEGCLISGWGIISTLFPVGVRWHQEQAIFPAQFTSHEFFPLKRVKRSGLTPWERALVF